MKNHKSQSLLFFGVIGVILIVVSIFSLSKYFKQMSKSRDLPATNSQSFLAETNGEEGAPYNEREWLAYTDNEFHYGIRYPSGLRVVPILTNLSSTSSYQGKFIENGGVSFASLGPGVMGVKVYINIPFKNIDEWFAFENQRNARVQQVIEKRINIDEYEAIVVYTKSGISPYEETFPNEKKAFLIKDGALFEIWTNFYDDIGNHKRVWDSFKFIE